MNMTGLGVVLANGLWFVPVVLLVVVLYIAARHGYKKYRTNKEEIGEILTCSIDSDCPPEHICIKGLCIPESKFKEMFSSMA